jgi:DedD protein
MNAVLIRRLLGAGVILLMLFVASLLLPAPTDPKPAEPGMRRVEVAVDDTRPITMPKRDASSATESAAAEPQAAPAPSPTQPLAPSTPASRKAIAESAEAAAAQFSGLNREAATSPEVETAPVQEDDDIAAAPSAETSAPEEAPEPKKPAPPPAKPAAVIKPPIGQRTPPPVSAAVTKPKSAAPVESKPAPSNPAATRPTTPAPAVTTAQTAPPKAVVAPPAAAPATATKAQRWAVQAGSYADIGNARQVEAQLKSLGFSSSISLTESGGSARYRVRSGPFATREAADAARQRMLQNHIPANVVPDGG